MNLSEMKQIIAEKDLRLTKSLGQNFLYDGNQIRRIITAAKLSGEDKVLEIGPGLGPLTRGLLAHAGHVLAIEKDENLVNVLRDLNHGPINAGQLELIHEDALNYLKRERRDWRDWKLTANLPYSVASPILVELALSENCPEMMVVTLQLEVARRLMAKPGNADYGILTLLVQLNYEPAESFKIPASCFFPEPDVDSACVSLLRRDHSQLKAIEKQTYIQLVKRGFSQRRKMMMKLLKQDWPGEQLVNAFAEACISSQARAETVTLEQFVTLAKIMKSRKQ